MNGRLFSNKASSFLKIDYVKFMGAIKSGDSQSIDEMLELKAAGCELNLNYATENEKSALEVLLDSRDFVNAKKLIAAGAETVVNYSVSVFDDDGYSAHKEKKRDLFEVYCHDREIIMLLHCETPQITDRPRKNKMNY